MYFSGGIVNVSYFAKNKKNSLKSFTNKKIM